MSEDMRTVTDVKVTSLEDLKRYAQGTVVRLPDFAEGQPFYARLKRPSLLEMVKNGSIPNSLLTKANALFMEGGSSLDINDDNMMSQMFEIIDGICEQAFVEPTYGEIKASGLHLTDEQMMFMFNYSQRGIDALQSFRRE